MAMHEYMYIVQCCAVYNSSAQGGGGGGCALGTWKYLFLSMGREPEKRPSLTPISLELSEGTSP
jgi:hypothetical protein